MSWPLPSYTFQVIIHSSFYHRHCTVWKNRPRRNRNNGNLPTMCTAIVCAKSYFSMHDPLFAEVAVQRINKWLELNKNIYRDKPTCGSSTMTSKGERPRLLKWPPRMRSLTQLSHKRINKLHITSRPQSPIIFFFLLHTFFMFQKKKRSCHPDVARCNLKYKKLYIGQFEVGVFTIKQYSVI